MLITFNKASLQELPCVFSTIVPLCFFKRIYVFWASALLLVIFPSVTHASEDVVLRHSFAGNLSFELTGGSQRQITSYTDWWGNNYSSCFNLNSSTGRLNLDNNSTVKAAYLYWSGSGAIDSQVTFANTTVTANTTYTVTIDDLTFYSAKADVKSLISNASRDYIVSNLTFDTDSDYCSGGQSYGGWALTVIYENASEPLRVINIFDGFKDFWYQSLVLSPNNFIISDNASDDGGKHAHITWEGDSDISSSDESLEFEGNNLTDTNNPSNNQFNSYSNVIGSTSGVDIDEYDISEYLEAGNTSVTTTYSSGQDRVFLTAEIISIPNEPVAELEIEQSGSNNLTADEENTIDFTITNNGPSTATANSEFTLTIPDGFSFVSTTNSLWSCSVIDDDLTCLYGNIILENSSVSLPLIFTIDSTATTSDSVTLTGTVTGVLFDNILSNNTTTETYVIGSGTLPTTPITGNKYLYIDTDSQSLTRDRESIDDIGTNDYTSISQNGGSASWELSPEFQSNFSFNESSISLNLCLKSARNGNGNDRSPNLTFQLIHNSVSSGQATVIAELEDETVRLPAQSSNTELFPFSLPLNDPTLVIPSGDTLEFKIINSDNEGSVYVYSRMTSNYCYVSLPAATVINVDSITIKDSSGDPVTDSVLPGSTISIEAVISDPFGSFDITSAYITITDSSGSITNNDGNGNDDMDVLTDSEGAIKTFSFSHTIPADSETGTLTFTVLAKEGVEGTVEHSSDFLLLVSQALPNINVSKTVEVYSDPIHGTNSATSYAKAFPGAILTYTVTAENIGEGVAQDDSIWISDSVPANTYMLVTDYDGVSGQGPIKNETANTTNGLTYTFNALDDDDDDIQFSNNNGADFSYGPTEDSEGLDKSITHFRINPKGIFQAPAAGESSNEFTIKFRVQLQ